MITVRAQSDGPTAKFEWRMEERSPDLDGNGFIDDNVYQKMTDPCYLNPESYLHGANCPTRPWNVTFDGTGSSGSDLRYWWTVEGGQCNPQITVGGTDPDPYVFPSIMRCSFARLDTYAVTLSVKDASGQTNSVTQQVTLKDLLIVSVGDSLSSGEGNPDIPGQGDFPFPAIPGNPVWQDRTCHRSAKAAPAQAALAIEKNDPHTSVTFLHLACSGATIDEGLLGQYEGQEPTCPSDQPCVLPALPPQIDEVARRLCPVDISDPDRLGFVTGQCPDGMGGRGIDAMMVSIGINDADFSSIAKLCSVVPHCQDSPWNNFDAIEKVSDRVEGLAAKYDLLDQGIQEKLNVSRVFLIEYPDPTHKADGSFCHMLLRTHEATELTIASWLPDSFIARLAYFLGVTPVKDVVEAIFCTLTLGGCFDGMTPSESSWAFDNFLVPLNRQVFDAAAKHGWTFVGGIQQHFFGHGMCMGPDRWIDRLGDSYRGQGNFDGALHPNTQGHFEISKFIVRQFYNQPPQFQAFTAWVNPVSVLLGLVIKSDENENGWLTQKCAFDVFSPQSSPTCDSDSVIISVIVRDPDRISSSSVSYHGLTGYTGLTIGDAPGADLSYFDLNPDENLIIPGTESSGGTGGVNCSTPSDAISVLATVCNFLLLSNNWEGSPTWAWFLKLKNGIHDLTFTAVDTLGAVSSASYRFKVDLTDPVARTVVTGCNARGICGSFDSPETEWFVSPVTVKFESLDYTSFVQTVEYQYQYSDSLTSQQISSGPWKCPAIFGVQNDIDEDVSIEQISFDCAFANPFTNPSLFLAGGEQFNDLDPNTSSFSCDIPKTSTSLSCHGLQEHPRFVELDLVFSVASDGVHTLLYSTVNRAGRTSANQTLTIKIDGTPPETVGTIARPPDLNGWYNHPVATSWNGTDTLSGIASCEPPPPYSGPDGQSVTITGSCTDVAGNVGSQTIEINYDASPPETRIISALDGNGASMAQGGSTLFGPATFTFEGSDTLSGVMGFECNLDSSAFTPCSSGFSGGAAVGSHTLRVRAVDIAGNVDLSPELFSWTIITPGQASQNLIDTVSGMGLASNTQNSLLGPLKGVLQILSDSNVGNDNSVCGKLKAFGMMVDRYEGTGQLTSTQAANLRLQATNITIKLGCT